MGFNKRFVDKKDILIALNSGGYAQFSKLIKADALIMDDWASLFIEDWTIESAKYLPAREKITADTRFLSTHREMYNHVHWKDIESPSCLLLMMYTDPGWIEVLKCKELFDFHTTKEDAGKFTRLLEKAKESVISYFDQKLRTGNLDKLIE